MSDLGRDLLEKSDFWRNEAVDRPEWLPEGWTMEVKTRTRGLTAGMKDRYYRDPVTGCKLRSKDEVLRYLTGQPTNCRSRPVKRCIDMCTTKYLLSTGNSAEWLPEGWITEIRPRKNGQRAGGTYRCYIAPSNGCKFYSKREVLCYLETGIISRRVNKPRKRSVDMLSIDRPHAIKRRNLANTTARRRLFGSQSFNSDGTTPELIGGLHLEVKCSQVTSLDLNQRGEDTEAGSLSLQNTKLQNEMEGNSVQAKLLQKQSLELEDRKLLKSEAQLEFENKRQLEDGVPLELKDKKPSENGLLLEMEDSEDRKLPDNRMLLQFENKIQLQDDVLLESERKNPSENAVLPELEDKTSFENGLEEHKNPSENAVLPELEDKTSFENVLEKQKTGRVCPQSSKRRTKKGTHLPCRASKRLADLKAKLALDLANQPSGTDPGNTPCASDVVESNHSGKPSLEEPIGNPENEKAFYNDPESSLSFPFGDSWPDPCLEFAFKTLTGVIPVVEDTFSIEDYFQQQQGVAHTQSPGGADGLHRADLFRPGNDSLPRFFDDMLKSNGKERAGSAGRER